MQDAHLVLFDTMVKTQQNKAVRSFLYPYPLLIILLSKNLFFSGLKKIFLYFCTSIYC